MGFRVIPAAVPRLPSPARARGRAGSGDRGNFLAQPINERESLRSPSRPATRSLAPAGRATASSVLSYIDTHFLFTPNKRLSVVFS